MTPPRVFCDFNKQLESVNQIRGVQAAPSGNAPTSPGSLPGGQPAAAPGAQQSPGSYGSGTSAFGTAIVASSDGNTPRSAFRSQT